MLVVADASPLIFLGRLDLLHLLQSVYGRVLVPTAVRDEVLGDGPELPGASAGTGARHLSRHLSRAPLAADGLWAGRAAPTVEWSGVVTCGGAVTTRCSTASRRRLPIAAVPRRAEVSR